MALLRTFVQFDGEGDTANARPRAIGGHPAVLLRGVCLPKNPDSPYANRRRLRSVRTAGGLRRRPQRRLHDLVAVGRWPIISVVKDNPTTLYIYPESADINAVAKAARPVVRRRGPVYIGTTPA